MKRIKHNLTAGPWLPVQHRNSMGPIPGYWYVASGWPKGIQVFESIGLVPGEHTSDGEDLILPDEQLVANTKFVSAARNHGIELLEEIKNLDPKVCDVPDAELLDAGDVERLKELADKLIAEAGMTWEDKP